MLSLLVPGALLGLLALAVPAVIHLRRPPPPTVRVGSLRHLAAVTALRRQPWRWQERARLALRLALLALLALTLAGPVWRRREDRGPRRWALVDPVAGTLTGPARERLEARRAAGDEVHLLTEGFPVLGPEAAVRPGSLSQPSEDVWSRLRELDARLPAGSSLTVFSPARFDALHGERPTLGNVAVNWVETPSASPRINRLEALETLPDLRVVAAASAGDADGLRRARGPVKVPAGPGRWVVPSPLPDAPPLVIARGPDGSLTGNLTGADGVEADAAIPETTPRPAAPRVLIFHAAGREGDARRLETAIRVAAPAGGVRPEAVVLVNPGREALATDTPPPDWVFCLGGPRPEDLAVAAGVATRARNLFTDAGDALPTDADPPPGTLVIPEWAGGLDVRLRQSVSPPVDGGTAVRWTDGAGVPVLTVSQPSPAGPRRWRFGSRFDPAWNDLVGTAALAGVLRAWFFPEAPPAMPDPRLAGAEQARPEGVPSPSASSARWPWPGTDAPAPVDLRPWALALAVAGFLLERVWAHRRPALVTR